jgi:hypothetical protein
MTVKLTDFSKDQLNYTLSACIERIVNLKMKRDEINRWGEDGRRMFLDNLRQIHREIEDLDTVCIQLQMAINEVEAQEKILMN